MIFYLGITTILNALTFLTVCNSEEYCNLLLFIKLYNVYVAERVYHVHVKGIEWIWKLILTPNLIFNHIFRPF